MPASLAYQRGALCQGPPVEPLGRGAQRRRRRAPAADRTARRVGARLAGARRRSATRPRRLRRLDDRRSSAIEARRARDRAVVGVNVHGSADDRAPARRVAVKQTLGAAVVGVRARRSRGSPTASAWSTTTTARCAVAACRPRSRASCDVPARVRRGGACPRSGVPRRRGRGASRRRAHRGRVGAVDSCRSSATPMSRVPGAARDSASVRGCPRSRSGRARSCRPRRAASSCDRTACRRRRRGCAGSSRRSPTPCTVTTEPLVAATLTPRPPSSSALNGRSRRDQRGRRRGRTGVRSTCVPPIAVGRGPSRNRLVDERRCR